MSMHTRQRTLPPQLDRAGIGHFTDRKQPRTVGRPRVAAPTLVAMSSAFELIRSLRIVIMQVLALSRLRDPWRNLISTDTVSDIARPSSNRIHCRCDQLPESIC
jgi:hypothetical protein